MRLNREFFNRKTLLVAKDLLGKYLIRKINGKLTAGKIIETEAYCGPNDLASHASKGLTPRTKVMFGPPGFSYVYMIYGIYHCLNIVTEKEGYPAAVLIRAAEILNFKSRSGFILDGPGKLCRELKIDKKLNEIDLATNPEMWIEDREDIIKPSQIKRFKRVGVDYAGPYKDKLWRFSI